MLLRTRSAALALASLFALPALPACSSAYYGMMETFGKEKRHIMLDKVEEARDDQEEARDQFRATLDSFKALTGFDGGELETTYRELVGEYERSESKADDVRERIEEVEDVAEAMFDEWEDEVEEITKLSARHESERMLEDTRARYEQLIVRMRRSSELMDPVLAAFKDQVLLLKHNLNARAVADLEGTAAEIETDVDRLIKEMEASIQEANDFLGTMKAEE